MTNLQNYQNQFHPSLPIPFQMDWSVSDKTGEEVDCIVAGFYNPDFDELQEVTLIDRFKNDITLLFVDDDELEEMILLSIKTAVILLWN